MYKCFSVLVGIPLLVAAASPKLRIGYYNHSMFEICLPSGIRIVTDPFETGLGLDFPEGVEADIVVMSHSDSDHNYWQGVDGEPDLIFYTNGSSHGIDFIAHPTKHSPGGPEGENHIMIWEVEGFKFAHMGDYGDILSPEDSTLLAGTTVLFIPVGGFYTINAAQAADIIERVQPTLVFPMHYKTPEHTDPVFDNLLTLEEANQYLPYPTHGTRPWIPIDADQLPPSPVLYEPSHSTQLPTDVRIYLYDISEGPPPYGMTANINNGSHNTEYVVIYRTISDGEMVIFADTSEPFQLASDEVYVYAFYDWTPPESREYTIMVEAMCPNDDAPQNDTASLTVELTSGVTETQLGLEPQLETRWLKANVLLIEYAGSDVDLAIFDVTGSEIGAWAVSQNRGVISYPTDHLPKGMYFVRLATPRGSATRKFTVLR